MPLNLEFIGDLVLLIIPAMSSCKGVTSAADSGMLDLSNLLQTKICEGVLRSLVQKGSAISQSLQD